MGAAQSAPSQGGEGQLPTTSPPRNKLTKPRTNSNNTREASCLPPLLLSRSSPPGSSKFSPAGNDQTVAEDQSSGIIAIEYSQTVPPQTANRPSGGWSLSGECSSDHVSNPPLNTIPAVDSDIFSPTHVSNAISRRESMVTRSSTNSNPVCAPPLNRTSSMGTVRRRSLILAAPPATATRKPTQLHRSSLEIPDVALGPLVLVPQLENDIGRCTTPSGYSVLGAFKRGSLRIANGAASPAPSSCAGTPDISTRSEYSGLPLAVPEVGSSRPPSRLKPIIILPYPTTSVHEVRLVPPSPTDGGRIGDESIPGSPFSFMLSPSTYDENIFDLPDGRDRLVASTPETPKIIMHGPSRSHESLVSTASSTICTELEYHRILAEQYLDTHPVGATVDHPQAISSKFNTGVNGYHNPLSEDTLGENDLRTRRPNITKVGSEGTDSGYSSSGSTDSRKGTRADQPTEPHLTTRKPGDPRTAAKTNSMPLLGEPRVVEDISRKSRTRSVVAAIRRRYSQGDLKASARSMEFTKRPPVPAVPTADHKQAPIKPRPELRHRKSMVVTKSPVKPPEIKKPSPAISPVPLLPRPAGSEQKRCFNFLAVEDYLSLVEDVPFTPIIDHTHYTGSVGIGTTARESVIKIGVGRALRQGSKITGQDYYQRFSRKQDA